MTIRSALELAVEEALLRSIVWLHACNIELNVADVHELFASMFKILDWVDDLSIFMSFI